MNPLVWPKHSASRGATFDPFEARLGFPRSLYRDDCARAVTCASCGVLLPEPATAYHAADGSGVAEAWCDACDASDVGGM
jgi:hypothetical protein